MNLLVTSANWRAAFVRCLVGRSGSGQPLGKVVTVDSDPLAASAYFSHLHRRVPLYSSDEYVPFITELIRAQQIDLIIPSTDRDCLYFSGCRESIEEAGAKILLAEPAVVTTQLDKLSAARWWRERDVDVPETWSGGEYASCSAPRRPVFVKPRSDSGSKNARLITDPDELRAVLSGHENLVVQEYIEGQEYSVDAITDWQGGLLGAVARKRLAVRGGTAIKTVTCRDSEILDLAEQACRLLGARGLLCLQFIRSPNGRTVLIEVNMRYGSGLPLSIEAGLDVAEMLVGIHSGHSTKLARGFFEDELTMLYYLDPVFLRPGQIHV